MVETARTRMLKFWGVNYTPKQQKKDTATSSGNKAELMANLAKEVSACSGCELSQTRNNVVTGEGNLNAEIFFVGEAPGFEEDKHGRPFVGRAGKLLDKIITNGIGIKREDVYIGNVLKCRPPGNRTPNPQEIASCKEYLFRQLRIIRPKVIIALGSPAAKTLLDTNESIGRLRGRFFDFHIEGLSEPIKLMPTYHPAYLLRNPAEKSKVWNDIQMVMELLGIEKK